jgi:RimJ/RimL family protein N-acetyltransferase
VNIVTIREPTLADADSFIKAMQCSKTLHQPWIKAPENPREFKDYFDRYQQSSQKSFLVCDTNGNIVGVFNISEIVRGFFQNAYLGFYTVSDYAGKGYMSAGLKLVLTNFFQEMKLHRLEANIQPENLKSSNLVKANGFRKEGYSPNYLMVNEKWCDHERWAITYEDWTNILNVKKL